MFGIDVEPAHGGLGGMILLSEQIIKNSGICRGVGLDQGRSSAEPEGNLTSVSICDLDLTATESMLCFSLTPTPWLRYSQTSPVRHRSRGRYVQSKGGRAVRCKPVWLPVFRSLQGSRSSPSTQLPSASEGDALETSTKNGDVRCTMDLTDSRLALG